jgi:hypothetical protein
MAAGVAAIIREVSNNPRNAARDAVRGLTFTGSFAVSVVDKHREGQIHHHGFEIHLISPFASRNILRLK